jgi:hypothetical protein
LASCKFVKAKVFDSFYVNVYYVVNVGLFKEEIFGQCVSSTSSGDSGFKTGRAFGILQNLSLVFSMAGLLSVIFCLSDKVARWVWLTTKILYFFALVFTLLVFSPFADCAEGQCEPGAAATMNMLNIFLLIGMVSVCCYVPVPSAPIFRTCGGGDSSSTGRPPQKNQSAVPVAVPNTSQAPPPSGGTVVKRTVQDTPQGRKIIEEVTHPDGSKTVTETLEQIVDETMAEEEDIELSQPPPSPVMTSRSMYMSEPKTGVQSAPVAAMPVYHSGSDSLPKMTSYSPKRGETDSHSSSTHQSRAADPPGEAEYSPSIISM